MAPLPPPESVQDELLDLWRALDQRVILREPRGTYNSGYRCWGCRGFVSGPTVTCSSCGQIHGGVYHEAYATR